MNLPIKRNSFLYILLILLGFLIGTAVTPRYFYPIISVSLSPFVKASSVTLEGRVRRVTGDRITIADGKKNYTFAINGKTNLLRFGRNLANELRESSVSAGLINYSKPQKITTGDLKPGENLSVFMKINGLNLEAVNVFVYP